MRLNVTRDFVIILWFISILALTITIGFIRIYYGGGIDTRFVLKDSFSFKDTIVNLDDLLGQPRIVVATKHPAVKKQLERMGIIETDEAVKQRLQREIETDIEHIRREIQ